MGYRGTRASSACLVLCLAIGLPATAAAQDVPYDPAIDVQLFEYAIGPKTFLSVSDAEVAAAKQLAFDVMVTFMTKPFTIYNVEEDEDVIEGERTEVVKSVLAGELSGAYGISDRYQVGVALPLIFSMSGDGLDPATATPAMDGLQISGVGDFRTELKARIFAAGALRMAGGVGLTLPSSFGAGGNEFIGDDLPSFRGHVATQWRSGDGKLSAGIDLGLILRKPRTIYASEVGQQFTYGAAASYQATDRFAVIGEMFGRTGMTTLDVDASPMEAGGGLRILATKAVAVVVGGSAGVLRGIGSPDFRVFASVGYAPDTRDTDGDGISNSNDRCTIVPEDMDGHDDTDGCPDDDNDGDRREDTVDQCPAQAEDIDGFDDDDGCPELDNDGDGVPDLEDRFCPLDKEDGQGALATDGCPIDKRDYDNDGIYDHVDTCADGEEDMDGFEDWDGCPDLDQDNDKVADDEDTCPVCPEDLDGFDDGDGCPEADNDRDGMADGEDQCPDEAEVINGIDDFDGCADEGGAEVATLDGDRMSFRGAIGFDRKGLTKAGKVILDQAALVMRQHPEVTRWLVAVGAAKASEASKRGNWVKAHLISRGVSADRFELVTSAGTTAVGMVVQERLDSVEGAAPMCPAGQEVAPRAAPAAAAATPAPAPAPDELEVGGDDAEIEVRGDDELE